MKKEKQQRRGKQNNILREVTTREGEDMFVLLAFSFLRLCPCFLRNVGVDLQFSESKNNFSGRLYPAYGKVKLNIIRNLWIGGYKTFYQFTYLAAAIK